MTASKLFSLSSEQERGVSERVCEWENPIQGTQQRHLRDFFIIKRFIFFSSFHSFVRSFVQHLRIEAFNAQRSIVCASVCDQNRIQINFFLVGLFHWPRNLVAKASRQITLNEGSQAESVTNRMQIIRNWFQSPFI